jgi:hypothetical protein
MDRQNQDSTEQEALRLGSMGTGKSERHAAGILESDQLFDTRFHFPILCLAAAPFGYWLGAAKTTGLENCGQDRKKPLICFSPRSRNGNDE